MSLSGWRGYLLACALLAQPLGCGLRPQGPSDVAQGRYFAAGNPEFDTFFLAVHRLGIELGNAPAEAADARHQLTSALVLGDAAANPELAEKLNLVLNGLGEHGLRVRLDMRLPAPPDPDHSMALLTSAPEPEGQDRATVEQLQAALTRLLRASARARASSNELLRLRANIPSLDAKLDATFAEQGRSKRSLVAKNLQDADRVLVLMQARVDEVALPVENLRAEIERVRPAPAALAETPPAPKPEERPHARPAAPRGRPSEAASAAAASPAPPKAAHEAGKSADFEP
jgi:hypothetical protein